MIQNKLPLVQNGKVILAGAGPGDAELVTVKVARYLGMADVVLTDRLVNPAIVELYVSPKAIVIAVGKQCRRGVSTPQQVINELMVKNALEGRFVVRLKGGDVSIFSNIADELDALVANRLSYEIVPGVTAALGAAAFAGIPLTARGYSTAARLLTYYKSDIVTEEYWKELANTSDTLVFYMSSETLPFVVDRLLQYGMNPQMPMAIIEQATTPLQHVHISALSSYGQRFADRSFVSPSLVIIGKVVELHKKYKWVDNIETSEHFFKPITSQLITITQSEKSNKHVTRA